MPRQTDAGYELHSPSQDQYSLLTLAAITESLSASTFLHLDLRALILLCLSPGLPTPVPASVVRVSVLRLCSWFLARRPPTTTLMRCHALYPGF